MSFALMMFFMQVKKLLDFKAIGALLTFKMEMRGPTILKDVKSGWRSKKKEGGGCLYDFASHSIDLISYLIGVPDEICGSVFQSIHSVDVEDAISSTFVYKCNLRGNLLVNWSDPSYRKPAYKMEIFGHKGKNTIGKSCSLPANGSGWVGESTARVFL